jgi:hypothetical protein
MQKIEIVASGMTLSHEFNFHFSLEIFVKHTGLYS